MRCALTSCCRGPADGHVLAGEPQADHVPRIAQAHHLHRRDVFIIDGLGERGRRELDEDGDSPPVDEERRARTRRRRRGGPRRVGGEAAIVSMIRSRRSAAADAVGASSTRRSDALRSRAGVARLSGEASDAAAAATVKPSTISIDALRTGERRSAAAGGAPRRPARRPPHLPIQRVHGRDQPSRGQCSGLRCHSSTPGAATPATRR